MNSCVTEVKEKPTLGNFLFEESSVIWYAPIPLTPPNKLILSPLIKLPSDTFMQPTSWRLHLLPNVPFLDKGKGVLVRGLGIYLEHIWDTANEEAMAQYKVSILDEKEAPVVTRESGVRAFDRLSKESTFGWSTFCPFALALPHIVMGRLKIRLEVQKVTDLPVLPLGKLGKDVKIIKGGEIICAGPKRLFLTKSLAINAMILRDPNAKVVNLDAEDNAEMIVSFTGSDESLRIALGFVTMGTCDVFFAGDDNLDELTSLWEAACVLGIPSLQKETLKRIMDAGLKRKDELVRILSLVTEYRGVIRKDGGHLARHYNRLKKYVFQNQDALTDDESFYQAVIKAGAPVCKELTDLIVEGAYLQVDDENEDEAEIKEDRADEPMEVDGDWIFLNETTDDDTSANNEETNDDQLGPDYYS